MIQMATTKIWAIKDSISRVISYAKNPDKTTFSDLKQVLKYAENEEKTIDKNEKTMYVTGVNCKAETAYEEMRTVHVGVVKSTRIVAENSLLQRLQRCKKRQMSAFCHPKF